jgi:carboxylesterase type B
VKHLFHIHVILLSSFAGFLALGTDEIPGNAGMYDMVAALQWVQKHISHFGGDPTRVTIAGQSAGGASVSWLLDSPLAKGLFRNAIAFSGELEMNG